MSVEDFSHVACPNPDCADYGRRGAGNLRLRGWSGRAERIRCLRCATCGTDFSERANTPLFGLRTDEDTLVAIAKHLAEGVGCRATARLCAVSLDTVLRKILTRVRCTSGATYVIRADAILITTQAAVRAELGRVVVPRHFHLEIKASCGSWTASWLPLFIARWIASMTL